METIGPSVLQTGGSFQHAFGISHTFSVANCRSFTMVLPHGPRPGRPALVRDVKSAITSHLDTRAYIAFRRYRCIVFSALVLHTHVTVQWKAYWHCHCTYISCSLTRWSSIQLMQVREDVLFAITGSALYCLASYACYAWVICNPWILVQWL